MGGTPAGQQSRQPLLQFLPRLLPVSIAVLARPPGPLRELHELTRTAVHYRRFPERHVSQLYARLRARKGHSKAIGAVARHLAEAAFHVLSRPQVYRDPAATTGRTK